MRPHSRLQPRGSVVRGIVLLEFALLALGLSGCQHQIKFEDIGYTVENQQADNALVAVITPQTIAQRVSIRSFMTGIAHNWEAQPGEMLQQVAEIELPQMFRYYRTAGEYEEPKEGARRMTVELSVPHYAFSDFRTTLVVRAVAYRPGHVLAFDKTYREEGETQGGKMF